MSRLTLSLAICGAVLGVLGGWWVVSGSEHFERSRILGGFDENVQDIPSAPEWAVHIEDGPYTYTPSKGAGSAAIVTTVRKPGVTFGSWLCYHLSTGFQHVYVFLDDAANEDMSTLRLLQYQQSRGKVTVVVKNDRLRSSQAQNRIFKKFGAFYDVEVMARQNLNAETAYYLSRRDGYDWLLHIDADELFYVDKNVNGVRGHFATLTEMNYDQAVYLNYEGVPLQMESKNFFETVRVFKRNPITFDTKEINDLKQRWERERGFYSFGYWTGKSAVRVGRDAWPVEVTRFIVNNEQRRANFDGPLILHYINPTVSHITQKYGLLGTFSDKSFDRSLVDPEVLAQFEESSMPKESKQLRTHTMWRDHAAKGIAHLERVYARWTLAKLPTSDLNRWLRSGLFIHVDDVSTVLQSSAECKGLWFPAKASRSFSAAMEKEMKFSSAEIGYTTQCENSPKVWCHMRTECCTALRNSKGSLKLPPRHY